MPKKTEPKPITLNEEQQAVVSARSGFYQVLAGPGAGKSACLVARLASLIKEEVDPSNTLSLSFTKTAAASLRDRVEAQVGKIEFNRIAGAVTFHSLALSFAQEQRDAFPFTIAEFPLADEPRANRLSGDAARRFEVDPRALRAATSLWRRKRVSASSAIKDCENRMDAKGLKLALAYKDYCKRCEAEGLLDFDSLIYWMVEILSKREDIRSLWVRDFLQLDESQDMSKIEWDLAKLISGGSVLAVGDVSQGIYGFRGSDSKLFAKMEEIFPGTKTLFLSCNYRSTPEIVDFIRPISSSKELAERFHTPNPTGPRPEIVGFRTAAEEANWVIAKIKESLNV